MTECPQCRLWEMAVEMTVFDLAYFHQTKESGGLQLYLLMNDVFSVACADGEPVPWESIGEVYGIWKTAGWEGLVRWVAARRGVGPLPGTFGDEPPLPGESGRQR